MTEEEYRTFLLMVMGSLTQFLRMGPDAYKIKREREWGYAVIDRTFHQIDDVLRTNKLPSGE